MSNIKVNVNSQNLTSIRVGQQNATKVVSSVGGLQGIQGLQGRQGLQGIAGQFAGQGAQGPLGGLGDQGTQGLQGLQGNIGYQGTQGLQGTQGRQGLQGNIGIQGFVGQPGGNAGRIFYFNRTDLSDIPGFYRATETPSPHDLSSTVVGLSTTDDIVIDQFVTDLNSPGVSDLPVGDAEVTLHVQLSEGSATVTLNLYLCEADGSGIFPISSSTSDIFTNTTPQELEWDYVRTIPYALGVTRRLIYNFHVNKITGSDSATLTVYYENNQVSLIKSTISAGAVGPQGIQGTRGNQGLQGNRGQQGAQGLLGLQGIQGISGEFAGQGTQGLQGVQGSQGIQNAQGTQGLQGLQGTQGSQGVQNTQGTQGLQGNQGTQGTQGVQGSQGVQGAQGLQGLIGPIAGSNTQVLFNDNNVSAGATNFVYDATNLRIGIGTTNPLQRLHVLGNLLVAAGSSTGQHITQKAYELNSGILSWEGSAGQLFSITNNLTSGSIFSVNDVSGIPSIDVNADGTVSMVSYGGNLGIGTTLPTSKLHVVGTTLITGITTVGLGSTSTPPNNSQLSFELTSDTNLRIKVRGSDGVLRSGNITLS